MNENGSPMSSISSVPNNLNDPAYKESIRAQTQPSDPEEKNEAIQNVLMRTLESYLCSTPSKVNPDSSTNARFQSTVEIKRQSNDVTSE